MAKTKEAQQKPDRKQHDSTVARQMQQKGVQPQSIDRTRNARAGKTGIAIADPPRTRRMSLHGTADTRGQDRDIKPTAMHGPLNSRGYEKSETNMPPAPKSTNKVGAGGKSKAGPSSSNGKGKGKGGTKGTSAEGEAASGKGKGKGTGTKGKGKGGSSATASGKGGGKAKGKGKAVDPSTTSSSKGGGKAKGKGGSSDTAKGTDKGGPSATTAASPLGLHLTTIPAKKYKYIVCFAKGENESPDGNYQEIHVHIPREEGAYAVSWATKLGGDKYDRQYLDPTHPVYAVAVARAKSKMNIRDPPPKQEKYKLDDDSAFPSLGGNVKPTSSMGKDTGGSSSSSAKDK